MNEYAEEPADYTAEEMTDAEIGAILAQYRSQQLRQHLIGPGISAVFHVGLLLLLSFYVVAKEKKVEQVVEIKTEVLEIKEPEKKIIEEIQEVQEEMADEAPKMEVPVNPTTEISDSAMADVSDDAPQTDDNLDMEEVLDVVNNPTPLKLPGLYGGRTAAGRAGAARKYGAGKGGQDAVLKALRWLAKVQQEDGSWNGLPADSGLALLCFLAHGETPLSEEFGVTVQKAIQWLATNMPDGKAWGKGDGHVAYAHGIATYSLSEAYGMTQIPFLVGPMESGIDVIVKGQQPGGGFDYNYAKGARWDMSVVGWQMQAMKAAYVAGCTNPDLPKAIEKVVAFTKNTAYANGKFGYTAPGSGSPNMTGIGTVGLQLLGEKASKEALGGAQTIAQTRLASYQQAQQTWNATAATHLYGWYYDTQAMFQLGGGQGNEWKLWNSVFQPVLIRNQNPEGYWTHDEHHSMGGDTLHGKVLATTLCCLQLEVYYRYLPTFKMSNEHFVKGPEALGGGAELDIK